MPVIPAKAGIHSNEGRWIPAFAGMTDKASLFANRIDERLSFRRYTFRKFFEVYFEFHLLAPGNVSNCPVMVFGKAVPPLFRF